MLDKKIQRVFVVNKAELMRRNQERGLLGAVEAWDKSWEAALTTISVVKFRNNNRSSFETSYSGVKSIYTDEDSSFPISKNLLEIVMRGRKKLANYLRHDKPFSDVADSALASLRNSPNPTL
jgi:hypothetical protein